MLDPDYLGALLHDRPAWADEITAILLMVFGLVTLLSLLNTSPDMTLTNVWADMIRQVFGLGGAILASVMIMSVGGLIVLPRVGVRIQMPWQRILFLELAFVAFLALLHLLPHDPEPRALARSGNGGGYIGWAVSDLIFKLFGYSVAEVFFVVVMLLSLGAAVGIKRVHIRRSLASASKRLEAFAERMKREPLPRLARTRRGAPPMVRQREPLVTAGINTTATPSANAPATAPTATPMGTPIRSPFGAPPATATFSSAPIDEAPAPTVGETAASRADSRRKSVPRVTRSTPVNPAQPPMPAVSSTPISDPDLDLPLTPMPASALATEPPALEEVDAAEPLAPPTPEKPPRGSKPAAKSKPTIIVPEKRIRHFTVEDFKEIRQPLTRDVDLPPLALLSDTELNKPTEQEINSNARIIENTLLEFDIDVEVVDVKVGPTVTQYAVQPFREVTTDQGEVIMQRVRVQKIASLSGDLALALSAKRLRIQPYVPGHPYMGIEVPNRTPSLVALRPVMESEAFAKAYTKRDPESGQTYEVPLAVPLGRDVSGSAFAVDLATMPHLLIAGTTGSGKSVCITALTVALVMNNMPDRLKLVMLDPKMVELARFNGLPHLLGPVETDIERIIGVLRWATREMDRRYKLLEAEACRNIETYNKALGKLREAERLPYMVIMVDEIGDLMLTRPDEMERTLTRLAQMARAVGIHLVVATQRPSVDIITGLIKANFPARISFAVASGVDSRVILDTTGAETLMGRGDMLYLSADASGPQRLQGCYVADPEIDAVTNYWKLWQARELETNPQPAPQVAPWEIAMTRRESLNEQDPLLEDALALVVREGEASASLIQRRLGIGYPRAAQLLDMLVELGVAGSLKDGARGAREVTMKPGTDSYKKLMEKRKK